MMRLSEAIRLGAISCKWGQGMVVNEDGSRCALGMAAFAVGEGGLALTDSVVDLWPWIKGIGPGGTGIARRIAGMNDNKTKTPLQIADWVETLERERGMWDEAVIQEDVKQEAVSIYQ